MKKEYLAPRADKMEFEYSEAITASTSGKSYQEFINGEYGCDDTPTDNWFVDLVRETGCKQV